LNCFENRFFLSKYINISLFSVNYKMSNYNNRKSIVSEDTLAKEQQINQCYQGMYHLVDFDGTEKQCSFAISLRNKLITEYGNRKDLSENLKDDLYNRVFKITDAGKFIEEFNCDNKKNIWHDYKNRIESQQIIISDNKSAPINLEKSKTWVIGTFNKNKITLMTTDNSLDILLTENNYQQISTYFWETMANINAVDRKAKENNLITLLLENGKEIRLEKTDPNPKPEYHDAIISKKDKRIIVECRNIGTLRAFLGIGGKVTLDLTDCSQEEIKKLLSSSYDIGFADKKSEEVFK